VADLAGATWGQLDPVPPSYLITVHYGGDWTTGQATTSRQIRLESERVGL
jgi:hypothetical protein